MEGKFILLFEDPFWVGYFERQDENGVQTAKYIFGAEPTNAQLISFSHHDYPHLQFLTSQSCSPSVNSPINYKRRQREIRKQMTSPVNHTHSQEIYQRELEKEKQKANSTAKAEKRKKEQDCYEKKKIRRQKKKDGK